MLPEIVDILNLRKKFNLSTRELASKLDDYQVSDENTSITFGWINQVEREKIKDPSYTKIKKIYDYFEYVEKMKGKTIEKIFKKIISFKIGDDIRDISNKMDRLGISQVPIYKNKICVGMLTDKIITEILELDAKNLKITLNSLEPIAPKIQYNSFLSTIKDIFKFYDYVLVEKEDKLVGILTRQDYNQALSLK